MDISTINELSKQHGANLALVIDVSGGKDSTYMMDFICSNFPQVKKYVVMSDTGFEHMKPISAEEFARERAAAYGLELHVVRNPKKTYLEMVERRGMFPSAKYRQCTSDLKRGPIEVFIRNQVKETVVVNCTGIRAAESPARAKKNPWKKNNRISKAGRLVYEWMPVFRSSLADVLEWHTTSGTPLHPVYVYAGGYLKRLSCRVCIFSTPADLKAIYQHDREAFLAVANLEQRIGHTMKNGASLFQIIGQDTPDQAQYGSEETYESACA